MADQIMVGVDGCVPATAAVEWAADDARRRGRPLHLVHVRERWPVGLGEAQSRYGAEALRAAAARAREVAPGVEVTTESRSGDVAEQLITLSATADSVVLGSRGRGGFATLVLGSVSTAVAGYAAGPVVIVRGRAETAHGRIVVGYDDSECSRMAMKYAVEQARARQAGVHAVSAWQAPIAEPYAAAYSGVLGSVFEEQRRAAHETVARWRDENRDVEITDEQVRAHPVAALRDASASADLVVVGSRGMGGFASMVLGSVSRGVLHHVTCPVAVVRPRGERTSGT